MNEKQKKVIRWGIVVIALMLIFPPWKTPGQTIVGHGSSMTVPSFSVGYHFIFTPPNGADLNYARLLIQWIAVAIVAGGLILTLKDEDGIDKEK